MHLSARIETVAHGLIAAALAMTLLMGSQARAADPVFPRASRIGLTPPPGFVPSQSFQGFQHAEKQASILMAELPGYAFETLEKEVTAELQKNQTAAAPRRNVQLEGGHGFVLFGRQEGPQGPILKWTLLATVADVTAIVTTLVPEAIQEVASDEAVRAAFASLVVRKVPQEEQLSVLPFIFPDLSGFRVVRVQPGGAAMLTEGPKDSVESAEQPLLLVSLGLEQPPQPGERDAFARRIFAVPGLKDVRITRAEPLRIGGHQGHEILVEGKDAKTDADVTAVQWLRFGSGGFLRMVGIARKDVWPSVFPRFRAMRDGVEPR
jgi:hypothetical protein